MYPHMCAHTSSSSIFDGEWLHEQNSARKERRIRKASREVVSGRKSHQVGRVRNEVTGRPKVPQTATKMSA
jgi:hypothetical protein